MNPTFDTGYIVVTIGPDRSVSTSWLTNDEFIVFSKELDRALEGGSPFFLEESEK